MYQNRVSTVPRDKLRPNRRQSSTSVSECKAPPVHNFPKSPSLRIRPGCNQGPCKHRDRDRYRGIEWRCTRFSFRPEFCPKLGPNQRGTLLSSEQDCSHSRGERDHNIWRQQSHVAAFAGNEKCPKCSRGGVSWWWKN